LNKSKELEYTSASHQSLPKITKVKLTTSMSNNVHRIGEDLIVNVEVVVPKKIESAWLSVQIKDSSDNIFVHIWTSHYDQPLFDAPGSYSVKCTLPKCQLFMGNYSFDFYISGPPGGVTYDILQNI